MNFLSSKRILQIGWLGALIAVTAVSNSAEAATSYFYGANCILIGGGTTWSFNSGSFSNNSGNLEYVACPLPTKGQTSVTYSIYGTRMSSVFICGINPATGAVGCGTLPSTPCPAFLSGPTASCFAGTSTDYDAKSSWLQVTLTGGQPGLPPTITFYTQQ
jgi:hypothetical protein